MHMEEITLLEDAAYAFGAGTLTRSYIQGRTYQQYCPFYVFVLKMTTLSVQNSSHDKGAA